MKFIRKNIAFVCSLVLLLIAFNYNGKAVSWTSIGSPTSGEVLKQNDIIEFNKSFTIEEGETLTINDNVNIKKGIVVTVKGTLKINGELKSIGGSGEDAYIMGGGTLNINSTESYNLRLNNNLHLEDLNIIDLKIGEYYSGQIDKQYTLSLKNVTIEGDFQNGWNAKHVNQPITEIEEGSRVFVKGDLTNNGTLNCNGRLVVGTEIPNPDGTNSLVAGTGTITNKGTINIETSDNALERTKQDPILENSVYYAAITARNLNNGQDGGVCRDKNRKVTTNNNKVVSIDDYGFVNMYNGSLILHNDLNMYAGSHVEFFKGNNFVEVRNDLYQQDHKIGGGGGDSYIRKNPSAAANTRATIMVGNTFYDETHLDDDDDTYVHDWAFHNNYNVDIDDDVVTLSIDSYDYHGSDLSIVFQGENKEFITGELLNVTNEIASIDYLLETAWEIYYSDFYEPGKTRDELYEEFLATTGKDLADQKEALERKKEIIDTINYLIDHKDEYNIANSQTRIDINEALTDWYSQTGLTAEGRSGCRNVWVGSFWSGHYEEDCSNAGSVKYNVTNIILDYLRTYGMGSEHYDDYVKNLSVMLPIELSYFEVAQDGNQIQFEWATESENNNDYFTVEYSLDGVNFNSVVVVDGVGNSTEQLVYNTMVSAEKYEGIVYFRLKQTDFDGQSTYSVALVLYVQGAGDGFVIYPNPATTTITIDGGEFSNVYFVDIQSKKYPAVALGGNQYSVENLSTGIYYAVISTAKGKALKKFIVTKSPVEK